MTLSSSACSLVAALAIVVLALNGFREERATGTFVDGCDSFGYSRMAAVFRKARKAGTAPDFFLHDDQTRWLIARFKENGIPPSQWDEVVTAHAHHYFPGTDEVGPQYPPGTGRVLSMFPRQTDVKMLDRLTILFVAAGGLLLVGWCAWRGLAASSLVLAGAVGAFLSPHAWLNQLSYSINATILPLFAGTTLAWLAGRSRDWRVALALGTVAGGLFGLVVQIRLASALLVPAVALLFVPRRFGALAGFMAGVALVGVVPVLLHNRGITGEYLGATYSDGDRQQALGCVLDNAAFYFGRSARESAVFYVLGLAAVTLLWLAVSAPLRAPGSKNRLAGHAGLVAAILCAGGLSVAYFLTHVVAIRYYLTPAMLTVSLLLGFLFVALETHALETAADPAMLRVIRNAVAAVAVAAAAVGLGFGYESLAGMTQEISKPREEPTMFSAPPEVLDTRAWVWADLYSSSVIYYTGHPAFKLPFSSPETRRMMFGWIKAKGDPQYLVIDSPNMERLATEARVAGWQLSPVGTIRDAPCLRMEMP